MQDNKKKCYVILSEGGRLHLEKRKSEMLSASRPPTKLVLSLERITKVLLFWFDFPAIFIIPMKANAKNISIR